MIKRDILVIAIISVILFLGGVKSYSNQETTLETLYISLGEEFILRKDQSAIIESEDFKITIIRFYNSPCPANVQCVWSGVGIKFAYTHKGKAEIGMMVQAFGYQTTIIESDFETYAKLKVNKI